MDLFVLVLILKIYFSKILFILITEFVAISLNFMPKWGSHWPILVLALPSVPSDCQMVLSVESGYIYLPCYQPVSQPAYSADGLIAPGILPTLELSASSLTLLSPSLKQSVRNLPSPVYWASDNTPFCVASNKVAYWLKTSLKVFLYSKQFMERELPWTPGSVMHPNDPVMGHLSS